MGDAAGQPADRLQLLHLHQRRLDPLALGDLRHQAVVRGGQRPRARLDPRLEIVVQALDGGARDAEFLQVVTGLVLAVAGAQRGLGRAHQGLGVDRPLEQHDVAQGLQRRHATALGMPRAEHDERKIRPGRLLQEPVVDRAGLHRRERLFGRDRHGRALLQSRQEFIGRAAHQRLDPARLDDLAHHGGVATAWGEQQHALQCAVHWRSISGSSPSRDCWPR